MELAGVEPASSEAPLRISFTGLVSFSKLTKLYHLNFWTEICDVTQRRTLAAILRVLDRSPQGYWSFSEGGTVNPYSRNRNFLFLGCYLPLLRLQKQLQLSQQNLVLREQKMDFRHLLFYIGYLRVSNANSACINSKNVDPLSNPSSPIFSGFQY